MTTTITWHPVQDRMPDADLTVVLFCPGVELDVWPGYFDGECWRSADGFKVQPTHWADMPEGPDR
jgi:hypothetical protein